MIVLAAHRDTVKPNYKLEYKNGKFEGLIDNFIGRLVTYYTLLDPSIVELEKQGRISFYENTGEEFGLLVNPPKLSKKDTVVVVDVCSNKKYKGYDIALENISGKDFSGLINGLNWEGYNILTAKYTGKEEDADEAFSWHDKGIPVVSFIIPIESINEGWHREDSLISIEKILKAKDILVRIICYLC